MAAAESVEELVEKINKTPSYSLTRTLREIIQHHQDKIQEILAHKDLLSEKRTKIQALLGKGSSNKSANKFVNNAPVLPVIEEVAILKRMPLNPEEIKDNHTYVAGTLPIHFYNDLDGYKPRRGEEWEGSTGDAFIYRRAIDPMRGTYIVKKMKGDVSWSSSRTRNNSKSEFKSKITGVMNEMNMNLEVTERIGDHVSKCIGTYLSNKTTERDGKFTAYFVFEYLPGMTLDKWIKDNKNKNTYREMAEIIKESLRACVGALSGIGHAHLDLKPKNIYVVLNEDRVERCILIDFGEALPFGTPKPIGNIFRNTSKSSVNASNFSENERFDPIKANTTTNEFTKRYKGIVIPEQNMISLKRIITYPTNRGGLGLSEGGNRRKLRTKKNNRRKNRTRRSN